MLQKPPVALPTIILSKLYLISFFWITAVNFYRSRWSWIWNIPLKSLGLHPFYLFLINSKKVKTDRLAQSYLGAYQCTLDAFIQSIETIPNRRNWQIDRVVDTIINFWLNNAEAIQHWKQRLDDAGAQNLLVARVADLEALRIEFESLVGQQF